jgi:hypothetical protein
MLQTRKAGIRTFQNHLGLNQIRGNIAQSMIGRAVDLLVGAHRTKHGIVSGVDLGGGAPKIVVAGSRYELGQILTVTPAAVT